MKCSARELQERIGPWDKSNGSLYKCLASAIRNAIQHGHIAVETVLPTEREVATAFSVSRTTVVAAYSDLKEEGLLASRQGRGTWVAKRTNSLGEVPAIVADNHNIVTSPGGIEINLASSVPSPPAIVREALSSRGIPLAPDDLNLSLPDRLGVRELREVLSQHLGNKGLQAHPDQILITTGATQGIDLAVSACTRRGDLVLVEPATFPGVLALLRHRGRRVAGVTSDAAGIRPQELEEAIRQHRPAMIYLVPTCQNPTGSTMPTGRRRQIAEIISRTGVPLVEDLSLSEVTLNDQTIPAPIASHDANAPIISIGSANKPLWMGLRVGWMKLPDAWAEELLMTKTLADLGTPVLAQRLLLTLMPILAEAAEQTKTTLNENMAATTEELERLLPEWEVPKPQGGSNLWIRLPAAQSDALVHASLRHGLQLVSGRAFSPDKLCADRLRLPFTLPPATMREAIRRLAQAWKEVRQLDPSATRVDEMIVV